MQRADMMITNAWLAMRFLIVFFVIYLTAAATVWSAPAISGLSGSVAHGGAITITGSGFGAKSQAAPLVWDTASEQFVNGTNLNAYSGISDGSTINTTVWDVSDLSGCIPVIYSASRAHRHSRLSAHYYRAGAKFCLRAKIPPGSQNKFYLSFYRKLKNPAMQPGGGDGSTKLLRGSSQPTGSLAGTTIVTSDSYEADHVNNTDPKGWVYIGGETTWVRFEIYQDDDRKWFDVYKNGAYHQGSNSSVPGNLEQRPAADWRFTLPGKSGYEFDVPPNEWNRAEGLFPILFGYDDGHSASSGQEVDVSEIYYDNTCQRVEVSDQPTWDDSPSSVATREVQGRLTGWSDTSISLALNQGAFSTLEGKYLYVVDANCQASNGVLLASTPPDTESPSTPASLSTVSPSTTQVNLLWKASTDNVGVTSYRIEACAGYNCSNYTLLGTSTTTSYSHTGIVPSSKPAIYRYRVRATDAAGNLSGYSPAVYFNARPTIPAFPGAQGAGAMSMGGRGGMICEVTNLNDSGAGSLRACINMEGPRTVVFRVGGTIELLTDLRILNPYLTIAGQTAPGGGILLSGKNSVKSLIVAMKHNIIIRYLRLRKGYNAEAVDTQSGDGVEVSYSGENSYGQSIIIDHCSMSWTQDENASVWGRNTIPNQPNDITYSWNLIAEPLSAHPTNVITGSNDNASEYQTNIDFHHNLLANSSHRNPLIKNKTFRFINNIVYNWSYYATQLGGGANVDVIGNYYKTGPLYKNSSWAQPGQQREYAIEVFTSSNTTTPPGSPTLYVSGNKGPFNESPANDNWPMVREVTGENGVEIGPLSAQYRRSLPLPALPVPITAHPVTELESVILPTVGASRSLDCLGNWVSSRDTVDARIINEYHASQGIVPVTENSVGGFPIIASGSACPDGDHDGMPDAWEDANGLDKNNSADGSVLHASGYSNLERFLTPSINSLLQSPVLQILN